MHSVALAVSEQVSSGELGAIFPDSPAMVEMLTGVGVKVDVLQMDVMYEQLVL